MEQCEKQKVRKTIQMISQKIPNIDSNLVEQAISTLEKSKTLKVAMDVFVMRLDEIFGNQSDFQDIYYECLDSIIEINPNVYMDRNEIINMINRNKELNITPGNISIEENHNLINETLKFLCDRLNNLGVDYYVVGALSVFIAKGIPLFRYHGDIDIMLNEDDIDKVRIALEDSDYIFEDNRLNNQKTYDPNVGHTQGEHEVIANHKENEFHIGFFVFRRERNNSITNREYYMKRKDCKDIAMVLERGNSLESTQLEYEETSTQYAGTEFRTSTAESVYSKKAYTRHYKDMLDINALEEYIDFDKIKEMKKHKSITRTMMVGGDRVH